MEWFPPTAPRETPRHGKILDRLPDPFGPKFLVGGSPSNREREEEK